MSGTDKPEFHQRLIYRFEKQAEFAAGYSPSLPGFGGLQQRGLR